MPAVERLEPKQLLNAILVGNDSVQLQQSQTAAPPVELNVLDNDSSPSGGLTITSVQSPLHGSASIVSADPNDPTSHDRLSVAFDAAFTGTEWFTYSVADADGDQATGTVTVTVVPTAYGSGSGGTSGMGGYGSAPSTPQVTGLMNSSGGTAGGTAVMIGGSGFGQVTQVLFGSTVATSFTVNSDASITAVAPPHGEGSVDVLVVSSVGASGVTMNDRFRYQAAVGAPTISSVSPGTSTVSGGDTLRITGTGFTNVTAVTVGGTAVSGFTVVSPTTIQVVAPPHMSGQVDVEVTTSAGTSPDSINDRLVYTTPVLPPVVMGLTTTTGSTAGGTSVTIMGANFTDVSAVWFGNQQAASFVVNSSTSITAVTPAELAGTVGVTVTNGAGTSGTQSNDQFTFQSNDPAISGLSTATGTTDGGTNVTIGGTNLHGVTAVYFGTVAATSFVVTGPGSISVVAPPQAQGTVDVTLVSAGGTSATSPADQFTYSPADAPPTVTGVTAPTSSGINIAITGTNFHNVMSVSIGGSAVMFLVQSPTSIVAVPPSTLTGTVEVTVTTAAGTSAPSTADQVRLGSAATGSSGSGSSGSGSSGTSSGSTGNSAADYVVVTQVGLGMDSQSVGNMELLGQMTGPGLPSIPVVPVNHPVNSSSADYANGVVSYSTTDGGTLTEDHVSTVINTDGSTYSRVQTGTTTFSYSSISSSSGNGPSTSSVLIMVDTNYHTVETLTAAHGTGYQRIWDQETITNYSLSTANGTSTFHNDVDEIRGYGDVESGVAAAGSAVRVSVGHQTTDDYHRIVSGTTTYGVTVGSFVSTDLGSGTFSKQSGLHTADETDTTSRSGGDHWNAIVQGTFTYGPDGSRIVNSQYTGNGGGSDEYTNTDEARSTVTTPDEYGSTIVRNTFTEHDAGTDDYGDVHTGTYVRTADGSDTTTETRNDGDSGTEDNDTGNVGSVDSNQTLSDGTVIQAHEGFSDTNDDISHYDDSENEQYGTGAVSPAAAAPGAAGGSAGNTDKFHHGQDDTDTFHTSETDNITATSTGLFGAVTTVTITGGVGDDGRIKTKDKLDDTEQLGANKADLEDDFTFDDQVHEQDKATGNEKIVIETHGLVAAGEQVDSKETISLKDVTNHSDDEDDVGTEEDQPNRADTEQDTDTIARHSDDDIHFTDKLDLTATQTLADGTVITNQVHDDVKHHIVDSADDGNTDVHTVHPVASGSGTPVADDDTFDNRFHETDDYSATDSMSQSVVIPVTGGTLRFGSGDSLVDEGTATETDEESGETNSGQSSANRETDTRDVTNSDGGTAKSNDWFKLITTNPTTGFVTNIQASDDNTDQFTDSFGDDSTQRSGTAVAGGTGSSTSPTAAAPAAMSGGTGSTGGAGTGPASTGPAYSDTEHAGHTDDFDNKSKLNIILTGSPVAGVTIDYGQNLSTEDLGGDNQNDSLTSGARGSDTETDLFGSHDHKTVHGGGHSNVSLDISSDDGAGNTVEIHESNNSTFGVDETLDDEDHGEEDITDANGHQTSDTEADTDTQSADLAVTAGNTRTVHNRIVSVDPATGLQTTLSLDDTRTDDVTEHESEGTTDDHTNAMMGGDKITGTDDLTEHEHLHDQRSQSMALDGTDAQGNPIHLQQTSTLTADETDDITDDDVQTPNGTNTDTSDVQETLDEQLTNTLSGTFSTIDPLTGVKTTVTLNDTISNTLHDHADDGDTRTKPASGTTTDTPTKTEDGSDTVRLQIHETVTRSNPNGTPAGNTETVNADLSDTETSTNGVVTDQGTVNNPACLGGIYGMLLSAVLGGGPPGSNGPAGNAASAGTRLAESAVRAAEAEFKNIPRNHGTWLGTRGNSIWRFDHSDWSKSKGVAGKEVDFESGRPKIGGFPASDYYGGSAAKATVNLDAPSIGNRLADEAAANTKMKGITGNRNWELPPGYTWHHAGKPGSTTMELVKGKDLGGAHGNLSHVGNVSDAKKATPKPPPSTTKPTRSVGAKTVRGIGMGLGILSVWGTCSDVYDQMFGVPKRAKENGITPAEQNQREVEQQPFFWGPLPGPNPYYRGPA